MPKSRAAVDRESLKTLQETKQQLAGEESFPYSEYLRSVMDTNVYTCPLDSMVRDVLKDMAARNISSAIVVDSMDNPVGILTERDIMQRIITRDGLNTAQTPVSEVMTPDPITLEPGNTIYRALSVLSVSGAKHLPLVENGKVIVMVSIGYIVKAVISEKDFLIDQLSNYISGY